jgi:hypothetical protein
MDHDRQDVSTPATRCAAGIMPVAVSLSNAPPTATPSSVMGLVSIVHPVVLPHASAFANEARLPLDEPRP